MVLIHYLSFIFSEIVIVVIENENRAWESHRFFRRNLTTSRSCPCLLVGQEACDSCCINKFIPHIWIINKIGHRSTFKPHDPFARWSVLLTYTVRNVFKSLMQTSKKDSSLVLLFYWLHFFHEKTTDYYRVSGVSRNVVGFLA